MAKEKMPSDMMAPQKKLSDMVILIIGMVVLVGAIVFLFVLSGKNGGKQLPKDVDTFNLKELHEFPPIEFEDTLYYKKVLTSYNDDQETPCDVFYYEKDSLGMPTDVKVHEAHFYPDQKKFIEGNIAEDQRDGLWYAYHKNGNVQTMAHYRNGKEDGQYTVYYENGNVRYTGFFKEGKRVGKWSFYDENEKFVKSINYDEK